MNDLIPGQRPDELETLLRQAMHDEVADVRVTGDGLTRIRERTDAQRAPWWRPAGLAVAAGATLTAAVTAVYALSGGGPVAQTTTPPAAQPSVSASVTAPAVQSPSATTAVTTPAKPSLAEPTGTSGAPVAPPPVEPEALVTTAVPVYYVADQWQGPRLFREFHKATYRGSAGRAALVDMIASAPKDPDYRSLWAPGTKVNSYTPRPDGTVVVDVSALPAGTTAIQQLVYTVTAAEKGADAVRLSVNGSDRGVYRRAPRVDVEGLIWVLTPTQGEKVRAPVTLTGLASVFEANLLWEVRRDGEVVESGYATAESAAPARADWSVTLELEPGTYEFRAYSASEAGDGTLVGEDTKTFTVR